VVMPQTLVDAMTSQSFIENSNIWESCSLFMFSQVTREVTPSDLEPQWLQSLLIHLSEARLSMSEQKIDCNHDICIFIRL